MSDELPPVTFTANEWAAIIAEREQLRAVAQAANDANCVYHDWRGQASTFEAADDAMGRLNSRLMRLGYGYVGRHALDWRGALLDAMYRAGIGSDDQGEIRLRLSGDRECDPPSGIRVKFVIEEWKKLLHGAKGAKGAKGTT